MKVSKLKSMPALLLALVMAIMVAIPGVVNASGPRQLGPEDFAQFEMSLSRRESAGVSMPLPTDENGNYIFVSGRRHLLEVYVRFNQGVTINQGDYFDVIMTIAGMPNVVSGPNVPDWGNGFGSVTTMDSPGWTDNTTVTIRFTALEDILNYTNIWVSFMVEFTPEFREGYPGVEWTIRGGDGSEVVYRGYGRPRDPVDPQDPDGSSMEDQLEWFRKHGGGVSGVTGLFDWEARFNHRGMTADEFFAQYGAPHAPGIITITDTMSDNHVLVPLYDGFLPEHILACGYISVVSVDIGAVWAFFQKAGGFTDHTEQEAEAARLEIRRVNGGMPYFYPYEYVRMSTDGRGFQLDNALLRFIERSVNRTPPRAPFPADGLLVADVQVNYNSTLQEFSFDICTSYFDGRIVFINYRTRIVTGSPAGIVRNDMDFAGEGMEEGGTSYHTITWAGSGDGGRNRNNVYIIKKCAEGTDASMAGAVFEITRQQVPFSASLGADEYGVIQMVTNEAGLATTPHGLGAYSYTEVFTIREVSAPEGFIPFEGEIRFSVDPSNNYNVTPLDWDESLPWEFVLGAGRNTWELVIYNSPEDEDICPGDNGNNNNGNNNNGNNNNNPPPDTPPGLPGDSNQRPNIPFQPPAQVPRPPQPAVTETTAYDNLEVSDIEMEMEMPMITNDDNDTDEEPYADSTDYETEDHAPVVTVRRVNPPTGCTASHNSGFYRLMLIFGVLGLVIGTYAIKIKTKLVKNK